MKKIKTIIVLTLVLVLVAGLFTACGGGGQTPSASSPNSSAPPAPASGNNNDGLVDPQTLNSGFTESKAKFVFTLETPTAVDSVNHYIAWKFKNLIETASKGSMFMNIYEAGQLGNDREVTERLQTGQIDFFITVSANYTPFIPKVGVLDLPNALPNLDVARKVLDGPFGDALKPDFEAAKFKFLGFSDAGFRETTSNKEFNTIDDFKGFKIRTMQTPNHLAYWKSLSATPTPMDFSEVYIALQQGTIDGQENPYDLIVANKLYEHQKYITETNHVLHALTLVMSKQKYDALPDDMKKIIDDASKQSVQYGREVASSRIDKLKKVVADYGCVIKTVPAELTNQMIEKAKPVYDQIRKDVGNDLVELLLSEVKKAQGK